MFKAKGLPVMFWAEAIVVVVYVLNRSPTKEVASKTPYEVWHGRKPVVHHLHTFGCIAYVKDTSPNLKKLDDRIHPMIFVGYEQGTKGYHVYDPMSQRVRVLHDIVFHEQAQWSWSDGVDAEGHMDDTFTIKYSVSCDVQLTKEVRAEAMRQSSVEGRSASRQSDGNFREVDVDHAPSRDHSVASSDLDTNHDVHALVQVKKMSDIITDVEEKELQINAISSNEPGSLAEAQADQHWRKAMEDEMAATEENKTWTLCELPQGRRAIGLKWVFKVKRDEVGPVVKNKARLVVKGYAQRKGTEYDEVFSPVARLDTVRLLIALVADRGWEMHHLDVESALLNDDLHEGVFVQQPGGFVKEGSEHKVLKLRKALYGLHQASRAWNAKLDCTLSSFGFVRSSYEPAIYTRRSNSTQLVVGVYVDDLVITGPDKEEICMLEEEMAAEFKMSDLGLLRYYLSIVVRQSLEGITLNQGAYAQMILEKSGLKCCNSRKTPMETRLKLSNSSSEALVDATVFWSLVGSLRYLVNTQLDIAFVVGYVSGFLSEPHEDYMIAVKHILRYLAGTVNWGIQMKKGSGKKALVWFTDSDFAGHVEIPT
jgi:hypothetical protein